MLAFLDPLCGYIEVNVSKFGEKWWYFNKTLWQKGSRPFWIWKNVLEACILCSFSSSFLLSKLGCVKLYSCKFCDVYKVYVRPPALLTDYSQFTQLYYFSIFLFRVTNIGIWLGTYVFVPFKLGSFIWSIKDKTWKLFFCSQFYSLNISRYTVFMTNPSSLWELCSSLK